MNKKVYGSLAGAALVACALGLSALAFGGTWTNEGARTIEVGPGESIQAAIDRARPGDTVDVAAGVYRENLTITTDGITLHGAGASAGGTVLEPPSTPAGPRARPSSPPGWAWAPARAGSAAPPANSSSAGRPTPSGRPSNPPPSPT